MARRHPSAIVLAAALLAVAAAIWAVSRRTSPAFAVYDSVPASAPAPVAAVPLTPPPTGDTAVAAPRPAAPVATPAPAPATRPRGTQPAATAAADTAADTTAPGDTLRHHRSENYGGYSGYGSRERRGVSNAR